MSDNLKPGDQHYRAFVGDPEYYDVVASSTFNLLTTLGLRQNHSVLDIGCGSLRIGRLLIPYLNPNRYSGIEPNAWLVEEAVNNEIGQDQINIKKPQFYFDDDCHSIHQNVLFDYVLAQSIFSHCGDDLVSKWIEQIAPHLKSDGLILATYVQGNENTGEKGWVYPGLVKYRESSFKKLVQIDGLHFYLLPWPHQIQKWCLITRDVSRNDWIVSTGLTYQKAFPYFLNERHRRKFGLVD